MLKLVAYVLDIAKECYVSRFVKVAAFIQHHYVRQPAIWSHLFSSDVAVA